MEGVRDLKGVLDDSAREVCETLAGSELVAGFYLAGGTGLALQLGHRRSLDLDFFQKGDSEKVSANQIAAELGRLFGNARLRLDLRQIDQVSWRIMETRVSFIAYPFRLLYPLVKGASVSSALSGIELADPREIAAMKAYALGRRTTFRDYIDLYFLLRNGWSSLPELISNADRKYILDGQRLFSPKLFLEQLTYTEDIEDKEAAFNLLREIVTTEEVETYLRQQVSAFLGRQTGEEQQDGGEPG